ncbi:long-chain-fatty-acid--CoA ligase [Mycobacteroides abscessus subsp. abscessus]|nr:long-chain-fatty-acid--CoA ligase [Mycobacteroides abscessus subsp. abscessus]
MQVVSPSGMGFSGADSVLAIVPLFHANAWGIPYAALMSGANVVMPDRFLQPGPLLEILANLKPTFAAAVPTIWGGVLAALAAQPQDISHLRSAAPPCPRR